MQRRCQDTALALRLVTKDVSWIPHEAWLGDSNDVAIWKLVGLLLDETLRCGLQFSIIIERNVAQQLLNIAHRLAFLGGGKGVPSFSEDLDQVLREVAASQILSKDGVRQCVTLVDGNSVRRTVAGVNHYARRASRDAQRQGSLDRHVHGGLVDVSNLPMKFGWNTVMMLPSGSS